MIPAPTTVVPAVVFAMPPISMVVIVPMVAPAVMTIATVTVMPFVVAVVETEGHKRRNRNRQNHGWKLRAKIVGPVLHMMPHLHDPSGRRLGAGQESEPKPQTHHCCKNWLFHHLRSPFIE